MFYALLKCVISNIGFFWTAINCLFVCLCSLCSLFQIQSAQNVQGVQQAKARKYYSTARDAVIVHFCGFLHDTLTHLSSLSVCLQRYTITMAEAHSAICTTQAVLKKYKTRYVYLNCNKKYLP